MGTIKHSEASKKRWAKVDPEVRRKAMSELAKTRWKKKTKKERIAHAKMMVKARSK